MGRILFLSCFILCNSVCATFSQEKENTITALMPLVRDKSIRASAGNKIENQLFNALSNIPGLMVYEPNFLRSVIKEQGFTRFPECSNEQCLQVIGTVLAVQRILGGTLTKNGMDYVIDLLMVNPIKGEVLQRVLYEFKLTNDKSLAEETHKIVEKMFTSDFLEVKSIPTLPKAVPGRRFKTIVWVPVSAVIAGGIGVIATYFYYKSNNSDNSQSESKQNELLMDDAPSRTR